MTLKSLERVYFRSEHIKQDYLILSNKIPFQSFYFHRYEAIAGNIRYIRGS